MAPMASRASPRVTGRIDALVLPNAIKGCFFEVLRFQGVMAMRSIAVCLALAATLGIDLIYEPTARAAFVLKIEEVGPEVVAAGSGSIDLTDLRVDGYGKEPPYLASDKAIVRTGGSDVFVGYDGATGPGNFGDDGSFPNSLGLGDSVGIAGAFGEVAVPFGYNSGDPLRSSAVWFNQSFAKMGIDTGTYVWTWGTGDNADSFTVEIAVPEPSSWAMMLVGFAGLGIVGYRATRRTAAAA
jgi:PEP-CTERM motif